MRAIGGGLGGEGEPKDKKHAGNNSEAGTRIGRLRRAQRCDEEDHEGDRYRHQQGRTHQDDQRQRKRCAGEPSEPFANGATCYRQKEETDTQRAKIATEGLKKEDPFKGEERQEERESKGARQGHPTGEHPAKTDEEGEGGEHTGHHL